METTVGITGVTFKGLYGVGGSQDWWYYFFGGPIIRIKVFWGLCWGPPVYGNWQIHYASLSLIVRK